MLLGMAERYDVLITVKSGVFPLTALAEGKGGSAMAVLRAGSGATPEPSARPAELNRNVLTATGGSGRRSPWPWTGANPTVRSNSS
ncbi:hypothetical protein ACR6C2_05965 [Streptomyces sp. INA 01156]